MDSKSINDIITSYLEYVGQHAEEYDNGDSNEGWSMDELIELMCKYVNDSDKN